jgi:hypothetical protein
MGTTVIFNTDTYSDTNTHANSFTLSGTYSEGESLACPIFNARIADILRPFSIHRNNTIDTHFVQETQVGKQV